MRTLQMLRLLVSLTSTRAFISERVDTTSEHRAQLSQAVPGLSFETFRPATIIRTDIARVASRWLSAAVRGVPVWMQNQHNPDLLTALESYLETQRVSSVFLISEAAGTYASALRTKRLHWDKFNVIAASSYADANQEQNWQEHVKYLLQHNYSVRFERNVLDCVTSVSVTSAAEKARFLQFYQRAPELVIPSAVKVSSEPSWSFSSGSVLWLGSLDYGANVSGLTRFLREGLPTLLEKGVRLRVVGSGGTPELVDQLRRTAGVDFWGYVADLDNACHDIRGAILPLWSGAGMKIKTLSLLARGVPVGATPCAFEGLPDDVACVISTDPRRLADVMVTASAACLADFGRLGFQFCRNTFSEEAVSASMREQVRTVLQI